MVNETSGAAPQREATSLRMLGVFFIILGTLVLFATCWTLGNFRASVVNVCSGFVLALVGAVMIYISRRMSEQAGQAEETEKSP